MIEIAEILRLLSTRPGESAVLATLVSVEGSSYRRPGARLLWFADGTRTGSISGGCLEEDIIERARRVLASGRPETAVYDTTSENDVVWGVGTGCAGTVRVFLERLPAERPAWVAALRANRESGRDTALAVAPGDDAGVRPGTHLTDEVPAAPAVFRNVVPPPPVLFVFGAGDDARPLVRMAAGLGWRVTVADARAAYATPERFPEAARTLVAPAAQAPGQLPLDARSLAVVMTHRYRDDTELLRRLLPLPLAFLGQLGPRKRTERMLGEIARAGTAITGEMRARLHAPVGLDLGGNTPETVALSILAEMQAQLGGRTPGALRDRTAPIHA